ncbi:MAG: XdhC family protein [Acidobacteriaceae bacterium]
MDEHGRMMEAWATARAVGAPVVLATLVGVRGASYRSLGARMLILEDGTRIGSLSGGCIEGELCRRAFWWTEGGKPYLRTYDTSLQQEEEGSGYGLGCGGSVDVWLERLSPADPLNPLLLIDAVRNTRTDRVTALVLRSTDEAVLGERFALDANGSLCGASGCLPQHAVATIREQMILALEERSSRTLAPAAGTDASCDILIEVIRPPTQLVVCGAGFDAQPLVHFAAQLGWRVVVCDRRADFARPQRFPEAHRVVWVRTPEALPVSQFDASTACILMTHSFEQDCSFLKQILPLTLPYVGVLGSRARTQTIFDELGTSMEESGVFAPAGLDIGAETPEEIAVSIMAEIRACLSGRNGGSLRDRSGSIHTDARSPHAQESFLLDHTDPLSNNDLCKV